MTPPPKRTRLAMAHVLKIMGGGGLDSSAAGQRNTARLIELLKDAAHTLDSTVKGPQ